MNKVAIIPKTINPVKDSEYSIVEASPVYVASVLQL